MESHHSVFRHDQKILFSIAETVVFAVSGIVVHLRYVRHLIAAS